MSIQDHLPKLKITAKALVAPGKGILAADESFPTIEKRFKKIGIPSTEENRQAYREMLLTTKGVGEFISGVILFDETIRQNTKDGRSFVSVLQNEGIVPGIKVDQGTETMANSASEKITKGLGGLPERLSDYAKLGAGFTKWRAVITIGEALPTEENILQNAKDLAQFAKMSQEAGLVPIVEPEVLMEGSHTLERCAEVTQQTLKAVFEELKNAGVILEGMLLKTNMVLPGKETGMRATSDDIAKATLDVFKKTLPDKLPGEVFLSGGQSEIEATANLNAMNKLGSHSWELSFSYGRALQKSALNTWAGKAENVAAAQQKFYHRAKMNSMARFGKYKEEM